MLLNSAYIVQSSSGKFVIKKENKDLFTLFSYLESRGFFAFPTLEKKYRSDENVFEYIEPENIPFEQKTENLAQTVAFLHNKTVYYKESFTDKYKEIKDNIESNLYFLKSHYESIFNTFVMHEYNSPSEYLFLRNYYKIKSSIDFGLNLINSWFESVKKINRVRVCVVHNNLSTSHFIQNSKKSALISWDNYIIDTPILDIISLYHAEALNIDFGHFLDVYLAYFPLLEEEKTLLFIMLSMPYYTTFELDEFKNSLEISKLILYIDKTEKLIRPYYFKEEEK